VMRHETYVGGVCVHAEIIDIDAGTYTVEEHGVVVEGPRPLTGEERVRYAPFPALEAAGALATLLVVEGVLPLDDAAHSVGTTGDHLVHEATAWGVG
jgi:hypothetical protein